MRQTNSGGQKLAQKDEPEGVNGRETPRILKVPPIKIKSRTKTRECKTIKKKQVKSKAR